jgi:uncharacterized membrane protein YgcG
MTAHARIVLLGLAGLAAATLLGLAAHLVTQETIALPATSLSAGDRLAPAAPTSQRPGTAPRRRRAADTTAARTQPAATTGEDAPGDDAGDDGNRRGRGRGGDSGSSGSSGSSSGSGSDDSSGRGPGRGGDD